MRCERALDLIDSGSLSELPSDQITELERHARGCESCGPAMQAARIMEHTLRRLTDPAPPAGLAAAVIERVTHAEPVWDAASQTSSRTDAVRPGDARAWVLLAVGIALAGGAHAYRLWAGEAAVPLWSSLFWTWVEDLAATAAPSAAVLAFVAGVALTVSGLAGLFRDRPSHGASYSG